MHFHRDATGAARAGKGVDLMKQLDPSKSVKCRSGRDARIFLTTGEPPYVLVGAIKDRDGWTPESWLADGRYLEGPSDSEHDLIQTSAAS